MREPLVSVIVPAYKAEKYILEALESIKKQTYSNWEIVVVEDAWNDKTEEIVEKFAEMVGSLRVQFVRHSFNKGIAATRNTGISLSKGEYIAWLDHDDIWLPNHLQINISALEGNQADLAYSTVQLFTDAEGCIGTWGPEKNEQENFPASLLLRGYIVSSGVVVRKRSLQLINNFDDSLRNAEDYDCWIRMLINGAKFIYLDSISSRYRKHSSSLTGNNYLTWKSDLQILLKYKNWEAWKLLPKSVKAQRFAQVYNNLAVLEADQSSLRALVLWYQAWQSQPLNIWRLRELIKATVRTVFRQKNQMILHR